MALYTYSAERLWVLCELLRFNLTGLVLGLKLLVLPGVHHLISGWTAHGNTIL